MQYQGSKVFEVTGNTFPIKDKIKKAGGKFNPSNKSWTVELYSSDAFWKYAGQVKITEKTQTKSNFGYEQDSASEGLEVAKY